MKQNLKIYGLIGYPLGHSFSKDFFNHKFQDEHISARYINFELPDLTGFKDLFSQYRDLSGLNVTIPYKEKIIPYLDTLDPLAANIGAVNVIKICHSPNGALCLKGYNSDIIGFRDSISPLLTPQHKQALVLGTGGASKAVIAALRQLGLTPTSVSRIPQGNAIAYGDLTPEIMKANTVIINTTPLGMSPHTQSSPHIPYHLITPEHICYDLVYNPETTLFMQQCAAYGATVKNGLEMLHLQALAAWNIWNE